MSIGTLRRHRNERIAEKPETAEQVEVPNPDFTEEETPPEETVEELKPKTKKIKE